MPGALSAVDRSECCSVLWYSGSSHGLGRKAPSPQLPPPAGATPSTWACLQRCHNQLQQAAESQRERQTVRHSAKTTGIKNATAGTGRRKRGEELIKFYTLSLEVKNKIRMEQEDILWGTKTEICCSQFLLLKKQLIFWTHCCLLLVVSVVLRYALPPNQVLPYAASLPAQQHVFLSLP